MGSCVTVAYKRIQPNEGYGNNLNHKEKLKAYSNVISRVKKESNERHQMAEQISIKKQLQAPILNIEKSIIRQRRKLLID